MTYFVGIDIAKYKHYASITTSLGEVVQAPFPFDNSHTGFKLLLSKVTALAGESIVIGYESTAHYHLNLHHFLIQHQFNPVIINPILTKRYRGLNLRDVKNDKVDSLNICHFLNFNYSNLSPSTNHDELNRLCVQLQTLKQDKTRLYIQLTACLDFSFPELKQQFFKGNLKTKAAHNLLRVFTSASEIATTRVDYLTNLISKGSKLFNRKKVESLKVLAKESIGINSFANSLKIRCLIEQIELVEKQIEMLLAVINNIMIEKDSPLLNIPGMGFIQAANILSVIHSIDRFNSPNQILAYAGLDPKTRQSGLFKASATRMSKRGNALLRYTLIWSAHNLVKNSKTMKDYYLKKRKQGKSHYNALGHCARKLVNYIFWILNNPEKQFILE